MGQFPAAEQISRLAGLVSQERNEARRAELRAEMDVLRVDLAIEKAVARVPEMTSHQRVRLVEVFSQHVAEQARAMSVH